MLHTRPPPCQLIDRLLTLLEVRQCLPCDTFVLCEAQSDMHRCDRAHKVRNERVCDLEPCGSPDVRHPTHPACMQNRLVDEMLHETHGLARAVVRTAVGVDRALVE
jgi:hypothetical protein